MGAAPVIKRILKYMLPSEPNFSIALPKGAEILTFQQQHGGLFIWALVEAEAPLEDRFFKLALTGHFISVADGEDFVPIGSVLADGGSFVLHLFEKRRK